ncbi:hypothetical protein ACVWZD_008938 [Streptomyces sp. TE3672]
MNVHWTWLRRGTDPVAQFVWARGPLMREGDLPGLDVLVVRLRAREVLTNQMLRNIAVVC